MDSNTITFNMLPSNTTNLLRQSPSMRDQTSVKHGLNSDESTNFIDQNQFKNASFGTKTTLSDNQDIKQKVSCAVFKTKIIQKPNKILKHSQKQTKNQNHQNFNIVSSRTVQNQNSKSKNDFNYTKNATQTKQNIVKKTCLLKSHSFVSIFDWMMEIASILRLTRTVFYRSCNIFYQTYKINSKILENSSVQKNACACLLISAKFQKSNIDYLEEIYQINKRRTPKMLITLTQIQIYQTLNWKLPILSLISQQICNVLTKWNDYLNKCLKQRMIKKETHQKLWLNLKYSENQPLKNKTYGEILYLTDIIIMNQTKKYLGESSSDYAPQSVITPIVMAMYSVFTIQLGDTMNKQRYFMPLFKNFYRQCLQRKAQQIDKFQKQIQFLFNIFNFFDLLSKIPLTKNWKDVLEHDLQAYLPVSIFKK